MTSGTGGRQGPNAAEIRLGPLRVQDLRGRPGTEYYVACRWSFRGIMARPVSACLRSVHARNLGARGLGSGRAWRLRLVALRKAQQMGLAQAQHVEDGPRAHHVRDVALRQDHGRHRRRRVASRTVPHCTVPYPTVRTYTHTHARARVRARACARRRTRARGCSAHACARCASAPHLWNLTEHVQHWRERLAWRNVQRLAQGV